LSRSAKIKQNVLITASAALSNLFRLAPYFHNKCQKTQLDHFIDNTQEAKSGNAELGVEGVHLSKKFFSKKTINSANFSKKNDKFR
jgi:hypothetical protein